MGLRPGGEQRRTGGQGTTKVTEVGEKTNRGKDSCNCWEQLAPKLR